MILTVGSEETAQVSEFENCFLYIEHPRKICNPMQLPIWRDRTIKEVLSEFQRKQRSFCGQPLPLIYLDFKYFHMKILLTLNSSELIMLAKFVTYKNLPEIVSLKFTYLIGRYDLCEF